MAQCQRSSRTVPAQHRPPGKESPVQVTPQVTPRLADLAQDDKEKIALIVKQFTEACRHRDELADVVKEQESQVHHLIRERWHFTQENTRLAKEAEQLRQKLSETEEANCEQLYQSREKMKKICNANKQLSEICTEQKQRLAKEHSKADEMETRYQTMVSAMKCLDIKLENSKRSIRKLRHHLDNARNARSLPAKTAESSTQTDQDSDAGGPESTPCCCCRCCWAGRTPPSCSTMGRHCALTSSGPLSHPPATRQASEVSTGPLSQPADTAGHPPPSEGAPDQLARPPRGTASQVARQGSAASRGTLPVSPSTGGGVLEWAAEPAAPAAAPVSGGLPSPCWHQVSATGQLALSPQAVEDWMLTKLFFSGRAPCTVAHVQLQ